jgi:hypothetical protein
MTRNFLTKNGGMPLKEKRSDFHATVPVSAFGTFFHKDENHFIS